jgi:hypothetical protein
MSRRLRTLVCLALLAVPLQAGGTLTAHAVTAPDLDSAQCTVSGSFSTQAAPVPETVAFSGTMSWSCTGVGDDAGAWNLSFTGQMSPGFCAGGQGLADVSGSGPDGNVYAGAQVSMSATTLHMEGTFSSNDPGGDGFSVDVKLTPTSGVPCVNTVTTETMTGAASVEDLPAPDEVACTVTAAEQYAPAITAALATVAVAGTSLSFNCTGALRDDEGNWSVTWNGNLLGDYGASNGTLSMGGSAPSDGAITGTANYERVGTMFDIWGTLHAKHDHSFEIWGAYAPDQTAPSPWYGAHLTGDAAIAE